MASAFPRRIAPDARMLLDAVDVYVAVKVYAASHQQPTLSDEFVKSAREHLLDVVDIVSKCADFS